MRGLDKTERHALRQAVRSVQTITERELSEMHPREARVACAEMRKRCFRADFKSAVFVRHYGLARLMARMPGGVRP